MCSCCVVPCTSWNGCLKKWIKTVGGRVVAMETASLEASFQSFLPSDNFLPILPLWTGTIPSWFSLAFINYPWCHKPGVSGMKYGKIMPGLHWDAVLWRPWEELTSLLARRPSRRPQVVGRSDSYRASSVKTTPVPAGLWCECIAPVALGTISGVPARENSALWLPWDHRTLKQFFTGSRCSESGRRNSSFYQLGVVLK